MKVVLPAVGSGSHSEAAPSIPKPMVPIANRPILLHIMKYYAHFGYDDFVICLGHKGDVIKEYFLNYNEALANDFVLSQGVAHVELLATDIGDWRITFVNTGLHATSVSDSRRCRITCAARSLSLATYGDAVTDAPLSRMVATATSAERRPPSSAYARRATRSTPSSSRTKRSSADSKT